MDKIDQLTKAQELEAEISILRGAMMNAEREKNYNLVYGYADAIKRTEEEILSYWTKNNIYAKVKAKRAAST